MKLLIKTTTEDTYVNAAIDILLPTIKTSDDLGKPLYSYPSKTMWIKEYDGKINKGKTVSVTLYIRKIKGGISIAGTQEIKKPEVEK